MSVVALERMRTGYERGNRPAIWLLLAILASVLIARHLPALVLVGRLDDELLVAGDLLRALPVLLAVVVLLVAPRRTGLVAGSMLLATAAVLGSAAGLGPLLSHEIAFVAGSLEAALLVAGPLVFGLGLGAVRTLPGVAVVLAGLVASIAAAAHAFSQLMAFFELTGDPDGPMLASSVIQQFTYLAWAFVLGAALERRALLIAAGAALLIAANGFYVVLDLLTGRFMAGSVLPEFDLTLSSYVAPGTLHESHLLFLLLSFGGWVTLIGGVFREAERAST